MPEGHTIHHLAARFEAAFGGGRPVRVDSPQGRFAEGAALLDGLPLTAAQAHGKHLFLGFGDPAATGWVHIHLGLYGKVAFGSGTAPAPVGQVRLRLASAEGYAELRGPNACALVAEEERLAIAARLGPDPLRPDADPERAWRRLAAARTSLAALLMDQKVIAGAGNVYRAEVLFRQGIDPYLPGRALGRAAWEALWADLAALMREGARHNRIDTVRPEHTPEAMGRPPRVDDHGGEVYVYRRAGQPCLVCGTEVRTATLAARNLFWCPACQPPGAQGAPNSRPGKRTSAESR
ncbi:Fpg/Nei family DNA glycosylase [Streptomyces hoynatensis]|uniref:DNA-(apurinic or apyrimidinic site) lyase n=1 Tax=Streptomyces hoynatensis TaxID=1141874 RepID=A0A3A9YMY7_9ACTN|nr:DNA-formamidopyrimidine glycosylase family protein [Streptomyces hoynatensis]RKN37641.1 Fpg/Nei family DNA glycosylase [Streptomyces hoynatensis]